MDYGVQVVGYIYPPTTGNYTFWIASDDDSQLWLNSTSGSGGSPAGATMIASVSTPTSPYDWTANASQCQSVDKLLCTPGNVTTSRP